MTTCSKGCNAKRKGGRSGASGAHDEDEDEDGDEEENGRGDGRRGGDASDGNHRRNQRKAAQGTDGDGDGDEKERAGVSADGDVRRDQRKAAKKAIKAATRARRGGGVGVDDNGVTAAAADFGRKPCDGCDKPVDLLIRCTVDETKRWKMMCGKCWKGASGGVTDGDAAHPHYRYGGLWKNRRAGGGGRVSTAAPKAADDQDGEEDQAQDKDNDEDEDVDDAAAELYVAHKLAQLELAQLEMA